jgi:hypothetical protein
MKSQTELNIYRTHLKIFSSVTQYVMKVWAEEVSGRVPEMEFLSGIFSRGFWV